MNKLSRLLLVFLTVILIVSMFTACQPSKKILYFRYGLKKDNEYIARLMNVSMRTYFRNLKKAIDEFTRVRDSLGYCDLTLDNLYEDDKWILKIKDREERMRSKFEKISA